MPDKKQQKQQRPRRSRGGSTTGASTGAATGAATAPSAPTTLSTRSVRISPPPPRQASAVLPVGTLNNHTRGGSLASKAIMSAVNKVAQQPQTSGGSPASERVIRGATTGGRGLSNIVGDTIASFYKNGTSSKSGGKQPSKNHRKMGRKAGGSSSSGDSKMNLSRIFVTDDKNKPIPMSTPKDSKTNHDLPLPASARQPGSTLPPRINDRTYLPKSTSMPTGQPFAISDTPLTGVKADFSTKMLSSSANPHILRI